MGFGFLNLPSWHDSFRTIARDFGKEEILRFPVLNAEGFEPAWRSLEAGEFNQSVDTGFHFPDKTVPADRFPRLITSDVTVAEQRLFDPTLRTGIRGAIGGTHPILETVQRHRYYAPLSRLLACTDGVCTFIFSHMEASGATFEEGLREAQWRGVAPGHAMKHIHGLVFQSRLALLASLLFRKKIPADQIHLEDFNQITSEDVQRAMENGYAIRVLGVIESGRTGFQAWVAPCLIPTRYFLAQVRGGMEAGYLQFEDQTAMTFSGEGSNPRSIVRGMLLDYDQFCSNGEFPVPVWEDVAFIDPSMHQSGFFLRMTMLDFSGSLSRICRVFDELGIQFRHLYHREKNDKDPGKSDEACEVLFFTQPTTRGTVQKAIQTIRQDVKLAGVKTCLRYEPHAS